MAGLVLGLGLLTTGALGRPASQRQAPQRPAPSEPMGSTFRPRVPKLVKVGLATDREAVNVPCCQGQLIVQAGGKALGAESALVIRPAAEIGEAAHYRVQVAALKDEGQAARLASVLGQRFGQPSESVFDAGTDLYRVRVGRFEERVRAEVIVRELRADGLEPWIVTERAELESAGFRVGFTGGETELPGRWLSVQRSRADGLRIDGGGYRGRILLHLNDRGTLNVINELSLEDYLRGVVPKEMGPVVYSSIEALKAQAVAARTYTVRNMGEFDDEGYDICATPRCQVFGGMDAEHPLSDQAIRDTAGQVLVHRGKTVDALYSSSCGGHTEDVEVIFPAKTHAYLRGVPCSEGGVDLLSGAVPRGTPFVSGLMGRLLPAPGHGNSASDAEARLNDLARLAGLPETGARLASLDRRDVRRFVGSLFDLVLDARLFTADAEASALLDDPPAEWTSDDLRLAAYLDRTGLLTAPYEGELVPEDLDEMLFQLSLYLGVIDTRRGSYLARSGDEVSVRSAAGTESYPLTPGFATFRGGEYRLRSSPLALNSGSDVTLYLHENDLLAIVQQVDGEVVAGTPGANIKTWRRSHTDSHLRGVVRSRYPEVDFAGFEILERGVSGRVGRIDLIGTNGKRMEVEGLAVRWTLDVPDTLFTARRVAPAGREPGWLFTGRGHGHGVGMCQLGAYGMGVHGKSYREILSHYYTDVELVRLQLVDQTPLPAARP